MSDPGDSSRRRHHARHSTGALPPVQAPESERAKLPECLGPSCDLPEASGIYTYIFAQSGSVRGPRSQHPLDSNCQSSGEVHGRQSVGRVGLPISAFIRSCGDLRLIALTRAQGIVCCDKDKLIGNHDGSIDVFVRPSPQTGSPRNGSHGRQAPSGPASRSTGHNGHFSTDLEARPHRLDRLRTASQSIRTCRETLAVAPMSGRFSPSG